MDDDTIIISTAPVRTRISNDSDNDAATHCYFARGAVQILTSVSEPDTQTPLSVESTSYTAAQSNMTVKRSVKTRSMTQRGLEAQSLDTIPAHKTITRKRTNKQRRSQLLNLPVELLTDIIKRLDNDDRLRKFDSRSQRRMMD